MEYTIKVDVIFYKETGKVNHVESHVINSTQTTDAIELEIRNWFNKPDCNFVVINKQYQPYYNRLFIKLAKQ